jgi:hypothetical protein
LINVDVGLHASAIQIAVTITISSNWKWSHLSFLKFAHVNFGLLIYTSQSQQVQ